MPVPVVLQGASYCHVWTGILAVTGKAVNGNAPVKNRNFITYIEVREQGAHDPEIRSMWQEIVRNNPGSPGPRPMHKGRVNPNNTSATRLTYYTRHGQQAAAMAAAELNRRWNLNANNNTAFVRGAAHQLTQQGVVQTNGHCYEVTLWYDVGDIYVAFHCYDPAFRG